MGSVTSLYNLICPEQQRRCDRQPKRLGGLEVDHQLELGGLLDGQLKQFIGTGPFRFVEHKPDRHVRLARFKDYSARSEPPNGAGGKRAAYLDELLFIPVPDGAAEPVNKNETGGS